MKAVWNNTVVAEATDDELIKIEGNWYFPPDSLHEKYFSDSSLETECIWKGTAHYYDIVVDGEKNEGAAWYYPEPKEGSTKLAKSDFKDYVAFWRGVEVVEG